MASYQAPGAARANEGKASTAPLVVLYERDDAIAVPLLSQLRLAGYDVRAARTPVDLFDILGKQLVSLVLVDLGAATAGRREFWVALDGQRRGRALQVMTFRQSGPAGPLGLEDDPSARALADIEVAGPQDYAKIIQGVRQRIPLHGAPGGTMGPVPLPGGAAVVGQSPFATAAPPSRPFNSPFGAPPPAAEAYPPNPYAAPPFPQGMTSAPYGQPPAGGMAGYPPRPGYPPQATPSQAYPPSPYSQPYFGEQPYGQPGYPPQTAMPAGPAPWEPSPFANPTSANPYAEASPFAQPYAANPFAGEAVPGGPAPYAPRPPSAHEAPAWSAPSGVNFNAPSSVNPFASSSLGFGDRSGFYGPGASDPAGNGFSRFGVQAPPEPAPQPPASAANISDTWIPPDEDAAVQTGIVPEVAYHQQRDQRRDPSRELSSARAGMDWNDAPSPSPWNGPASRVEWEAPQAQAGQIPLTTRNLPAVQSQSEQALGTVLVEGALLTPNKLEVLRGIQAMLSNVRMDYKLGELALLFRFLSPDQLLAALLVSRGLVTPQQIAGLGRVKQELAASGMDQDLESLLIMFHMLSPEQLRQIRAELL